jgi:hypothetical protein
MEIRDRSSNKFGLASFTLDEPATPTVAPE